MDKSGASVYVYAKASGMLSKSFIGPRSSKLFEVKKLSELWTLVFDDEVPLIPEVMLAKQIEKRAEEKFIKEFIGLLDCYTKPEPVALALLQYYDFCNIKDILNALNHNDNKLPQITDIGKYKLLDYTSWPNLKKMTENTQLDWLSTVFDKFDQKEIDHKLDVQYVRLLWKAIQLVPQTERQPVQRMLLEQIILDNCLWVIRLRIYYNLQKEQILPLLAGLSDIPDVNDILAGEAVKIIDFDINTYSDWEKWRFSQLLNPHEEGVVWQIDPRWVQQKANIKINKIAMKQFHRYPFTADVLISWFKIKQHELACIRTAAEGMRLSVAESQVMAFAGIEE